MKTLGVLFALLGASSALANDFYQTGSQWDKRLVTAKDLEAGSPTLKKAMRALGRVTGGASAFYIGKWNGHHLGVSNHHVYPGGCRGEQIPFPFLKKSYWCTNLVGTWLEMDMTIFEMDVPAADETLLAGAALKMGFRAEIYPGQKLVNVGFGHHRNPQLLPAADDSEDCMVISGKNDFRRVQVPDDPEYNIWSVANGCEASPGDSGSAILDRATGEVVLVLWASKPGKIEKIQDSAFLKQLTQTQGPEVWTELNYGAPVPKLLELIRRDVADASSSLTPEARTTLKALIEGN